MKKFTNYCLLMACLVFILSSSWVMAASGKIQFCETLTDKFEIINPGDKFPGPTVSWLAASQEPFGKPKIVISIYRDTDATQSLLLRRELEVNPAWNNIGLKNMPIPEPGRYTIVLSQTDGNEIASGTVTILTAMDDEPIKPEEKIGGTLEELFNKYNPKNK